MIVIDDFWIDASLTETHTLESDVTEYPVESGSTLADNVRARPITVEIEGIVSDTPLPGPIANMRGSTDSNGNFAHKPSRDALAALEAIYDAREPVEIVTELKTYENMAMTSLVIPRDAETGFALRFTATFQQIILITNNRTLIKVAPPQDTGLGRMNDLGNKGIDYKHGVNGKEAAILWHHTSPKPTFSFIETLGVQGNIPGGHTGLFHANGVELTDDEFAQWQSDQALWFRTHNKDGTQILSPDDAIKAGNNTEDFNGIPLPVAQQSDGTWRDAGGRPVTYAPNFGSWILEEK